MKKKIISLFLAVIMIVGVIPLSAITAFAENVPDSTSKYIVRSWDETKKQVVSTEEDIPETAQEITTDTRTLTSGWYFLSGEVEIDDAITVSGDAHIILVNGAVCTVKKGIAATNGANLTFYAQTEDFDRMGKVVVTKAYSGNAGIGSMRQGECGGITINGGAFYVQGGLNAAGIGGGADGKCGTITVNGGKVFAIAGDSGAGIGSGSKMDDGYENICAGVVINSGAIIAAGQDGAENIGAGKDSPEVTVTVAVGLYENYDYPVSFINIEPFPKTMPSCADGHSDYFKNCVSGKYYTTETLEPDSLIEDIEAWLAGEGNTGKGNGKHADKDKDGYCDTCGTFAKANINFYISHGGDPAFTQPCSADEELMEQVDALAVKAVENRYGTGAGLVNYMYSDGNLVGEYDLVPFGTESMDIFAVLAYDETEPNRLSDGHKAYYENTQDGYFYEDALCVTLIGDTDDLDEWFSTSEENGGGMIPRTGDEPLVTPTADDFTFISPANCVYNGQAKQASVTTDKEGMGKITVKYQKKNGDGWDTATTNAPTEIGKYRVVISVEEGANYAASVADITSDSWVFEIIHTHDFTGEYTDNCDGTHSRKCTGCDELGTPEEHTYTNGVCVCGATNGHTHDFTGAYTDIGNNGCFKRQCTGCGEYGGATIMLYGNGTETSPYRIATLEQLENLVAIVNSGNNLTENYIVLADNIEGLTTPIGDNNHPFDGNFDGGDFTVTLAMDLSDRNCVGLFGQIGENGTVQNIKVTGTVKGNDYVAGVCGYMGGGTLRNCISSAAISGRGCVGGVCGVNYGTIDNCQNTGKVTADGDNIGGVCGNNYGGTTEYCQNSGTVSGNHYVGGVCGFLTDGTVENCQNSGTVSANESNAGGVCGNNQNGTVKNCQNSGTVSGNNYVGGVCSYNDNRTGTGGILQNCFNSGDVTGTGDCAGGICGKNNYGFIRNCGNFGDVSGYMIVGGVCGENYDGTLLNCYSGGSVRANMLAGIGGVFGTNYNNATVDNCYYDSTVFSGVQEVGSGKYTGTALGLSTTLMTAASGTNGALVDRLNDYIDKASAGTVGWLHWENTEGAYPVFAEISVNYLDENGEIKSQVTGGNIRKGRTEYTSGWYYLSEDVVFDRPVVINGDVVFILCNGATLTANKGILLTSGNSLTVYAQSADEDMGKIIATGDDLCAGIGGGFKQTAGDFTVNGGYVKATGGYAAPGIGGGFGGKDGTFTKNGGIVEVVNGEGYTSAHEHTFADTYTYNEAHHWYACTCEDDDCKGNVTGFGAHTFGDGEVNGNVTEYTCSECGYKKYVYNTAGDNEGEIVTGISYTGISLTLGSDIAINFYMNLTEETRQNGKMTFDIGGRIVTLKGTDAKWNETEKKYYFQTPLTALEMNETVKATFTYNGIEYVQKYSVADYIDKIVGNPEKYGKEAAALAKKIANYGHYAQIYLESIHTNVHIVDSGDGYDRMDKFESFDIDTQAAIKALANYSVKVTGTSENLSLYGSTVYFDSATALNYYVTVKNDVKPSATAVNTETGKSKDVEIKLYKNNIYIVSVKDITATELADDIEVTIDDEITITGSVFAYCNSVVKAHNIDGASEKDIFAVNAMAAFYEYYEAACEYADNKQG